MFAKSNFATRIFRNGLVYPRSRSFLTSNGTSFDSSNHRAWKSHYSACFKLFSTTAERVNEIDFISSKHSRTLVQDKEGTYTTIPRQAWDMGVHLFAKAHAWEELIELLSDTSISAEGLRKVEAVYRIFDAEGAVPGLVDLQKEHARLNNLFETMASLLAARENLQDMNEMQQEADGEIAAAMKLLPGKGLVPAEVEADEGLQSWLSVKTQTNEEISAAKEEIAQLEGDLLDHVLPKDKDDSRNAILEVRPGTGGDEAMIFAREMFALYQSVASEMGWRFEVIEVNETEAGGFRDASANISGERVFGSLKFETGVHRVQRIPVTETMGRVHTSTMTVAVLPEVQDVDIVIRDCDLKIDVYRASGAGGQHVNTTESAVRITHLPTGTVVTNQDQRSQHKNKEKAMQVLRARIYEEQRRKIAEDRARLRGAQIGSGDRSERIRTYNFPQGRVTDHRINFTLHNIDNFMAGTSFEDLLDKLKQQERLDILASELGDKANSPTDKAKKGKK